MPLLDFVGTEGVVGTVGTTDKLQFSAADLDFTVNGSSGLAKGTTVKDLTDGDLVGMQTLDTSAGAVSGTSTTSFFKLTTTNTAFTDDVKGTFVAALGGKAKGLVVIPAQGARGMRCC